MKGIIESEYHYNPNGMNGGGIKSVMILGDDGVVYFGHKTNFLRKSKHYKKGRTVTFDAIDESRTHLAATNIDVEVPINPQKEEIFECAFDLQDGGYVKRIIKPDGTKLSLIIKNGKLIISCLREYERDMIWMYRRGPSGV